MKLDILRDIGLSEGEITIYSALLDLGKAPVNKIHEKVGIERRNIYDILNKLIERGLVSYISENKKRFFRLSHPNKLLAYIEEKQDELNTTKEQVESQIPDILKKFNISEPEINAEIFRGEEGVKAVWEDSLNYKEMLWIAAGRYVPIKHPTWFKHWNERRIKRKSKWFNLLRHELKGKAKQMELEELRFLPKDFSGDPAVIGIYGNKVVNMLLGDRFFAFVIESKELAQSYRKYHKYLWDKVAQK